MGGLAKTAARAIGTVTTRSRTVRKKSHWVYVATADGETVCVEFVERFRLLTQWVKVSHHGQWYQRWRPLARHLWETKVGPIPAGYRVHHRDGNSLNNALDNLVLSRESSFAIILAADPKARKRQKRRQAKAVSTANRHRAAVAAAILQPARWYVIILARKVVFFVPYRSQRQAERLFPARVAEFPDLVGLKWLAILGSDIAANMQPDRPLEDFRRFLPDLESPEGDD